jgi:hypothetical protein
MIMNSRFRNRYCPVNRTVLFRLSVLLPALLTMGIFVEAAQADVYRWTAPSGRVVYGDDPPDRASLLQRVDIEECNTPSCRLAETARASDAEKRYQEIEEWLDRRTEARGLSKTQTQRMLYVPVYTPAYPIFTPARHFGIHRGLHRRHRLPEQPFRHGRSSRLRHGTQARIRFR